MDRDRNPFTIDKMLRVTRYATRSIKNAVQNTVAEAAAQVAAEGGQITVARMAQAILPTQTEVEGGILLGEAANSVVNTLFPADVDMEDAPQPGTSAEPLKQGLKRKFRGSNPALPGMPFDLGAMLNYISKRRNAKKSFKRRRGTFRRRTPRRVYRSAYRRPYRRTYRRRYVRRRRY